MKVSRHAKIIELISQYDIETQEELAERIDRSTQFISTIERGLAGPERHYAKRVPPAG